MKIYKLHSILAITLGLIGLSYAEEGKINRLLFLGNSITLHGPSEKIGWSGNWGMAATEQAKDYVHLVVDSLGKKQGLPPEFKVSNVADFERAYEKFDAAVTLKEQIDFKADTVVLAIGENVPPLKTDEEKEKFKTGLLTFLHLIKPDDSTKLYVRSCFWADPAKDEILKSACEQVGGVFIDIGLLGKDESNYARSERKIDHQGVANHPGDKGMQEIAAAISAAIEKK